VRIHIRCCCTPQLVLGTVDVDEARVWDESVILFPLQRTWSPRDEAAPGEPTPAPLRLTVRTISDERDGRRRRELALHSNDTPIETLRRIRSFIEINAPVAIGGGA
jgi:hypothetical protein